MDAPVVSIQVVQSDTGEFVFPESGLPQHPDDEFVPKLGVRDILTEQLFLVGGDIRDILVEFLRPLRLIVGLELDIVHRIFCYLLHRLEPIIEDFEAVIVAGDSWWSVAVIPERVEIIFNLERHDFGDIVPGLVTDPLLELPEVGVPAFERPIGPVLIIPFPPEDSLNAGIHLLSLLEIPHVSIDGPGIDLGRVLVQCLESFTDVHLLDAEIRRQVGRTPGLGE